MGGRLATRILDGLRSSVAVVDRRGVILAVNRRWAEFSMANGGRWSAVGPGANYLGVCDAAVGEDRPAARAMARELRRVLAGRSREHAMEYPCHSGVVQRWFVGRVMRLKGVGAAAAVLVHEEVTERHAALASLRLNDERFRVALAGAPLVVFNQDRELRYTWVVNPSLGAREEEILGRTDGELNAPEFAEPLTRLKRQVLATGKGVRREIYLRRQGMAAYYDVTLEPLRDARGVVTGITGAAYDITPAKRAQEKVRESEERLQHVLGIANEGVWDWNLREDVAYLSPKYYELTGYRPGEVVANLEFFRQLVHPDDLEEVMRTITEHLAGRTPKSVVEYRIVTREGQVRWLAGMGQVVERDAAGAPVRMMGTVVDVTERRRAAAELEASQRALRALTARLHSAREGERLRIARVVHDQLGHAFTDLKLDLAWLDRRLREAQVPTAGVVRRRLRAMIRRVESDLEVTRRLSTELRPAVLDTLGLTAALEWALREFEGRARVRGRIEVPTVPVELGERESTALFRIFQEILSNVGRHARATRVTVKLTVEAEVVRLVVADDGRGITPRQVRNPLALGLLGMRERALELGGMVEVKGVAGKGTKVTVELPRRGE